MLCVNAVLFLLKQLCVTKYALVGVKKHIGKDKSGDLKLSRSAKSDCHERLTFPQCLSLHLLSASV